MGAVLTWSSRRNDATRLTRCICGAAVGAAAGGVDGLIYDVATRKK
jgi:hypothetical protein